MVYQTQSAPVGKSGSITFATANGKIRTTEVVPMHCEVFGTDIAPFLLPETPSVLSVGRRCMEEQYDFHWIRGQKPYLVTPEYKVVQLEVHRNIPMLMVGDPSAVARDARGYCTVPVAPVMVEERDDMFGENVLDEYIMLEGEAQELPELSLIHI